MDDIERCLLVKQEVFVYKIPPRQSARGYRAADWNLSAPDWTGRMRVMHSNKTVKLKLEDKGSGELFAACPIDQYPGPAVEAVTDSSRYFVIKIVDESGRSAYIGMGFADRSDSFDLNVALQDHFKLLKKEDEFAKVDELPQTKLDLAFKEGQTIKVNINLPKVDRVARPKNRNGGGGGLLLPPPPGGVQKPAQPQPAAPGPANLTPLSSPIDVAKPMIGSGGNSNLDLLCDIGLDPVPAPAPVMTQDDPWGDFATAGNTDKNSSGNWVQF